MLVGCGTVVVIRKGGLQHTHAHTTNTYSTRARGATHSKIDGEAGRHRGQWKGGGGGGTHSLALHPHPPPPSPPAPAARTLMTTLYNTAVQLGGTAQQGAPAMPSP